jgi:hypothetical protein
MLDSQECGIAALLKCGIAAVATLRMRHCRQDAIAIDVTSLRLELEVVDRVAPWIGDCSSSTVIAAWLTQCRPCERGWVRRGPHVHVRIHHHMGKAMRL